MASPTAEASAPPLESLEATPVVATPVVATPVVATPVVATPVVATPVVATPQAVSFQRPSDWPPESLTNSAPFTWLWEDKGNNGEKGPEKSEWRAFRRCDQKRLEAAELKKDGEFALVEGGRWKVNLKERLLLDSYGSDPPLKRCPVKRSRWFYRSGGALLPYDEQVDDLIEQAYQKVTAQITSSTPSESAEISEVVPLESGRTVCLKLKCKSSKWKLTAEERAATATTWVAYAKSALEKVFELQRGFGEVRQQAGEVEEEILGHEIGQVIILVHGIGEKMWSEEGGLPLMSQFGQTV